jgi:hypothetical protein
MAMEAVLTAVLIPIRISFYIVSFVRRLNVKQ